MVTAAGGVATAAGGVATAAGGVAFLKGPPLRPPPFVRRSGIVEYSFDFLYNSWKNRSIVQLRLD